MADDRPKQDSGQKVMEAHAGTYVPKDKIAGPKGEAPSLRPASLGGLSGMGLITAMRGAEGSLVEGNGTWRADDAGVDMAELRDTFQEGEETTFEGSIFDERSDGAHVSEIRTKVSVTGVVEYEDKEGQPVRIVNFLYQGTV